MDGSSWLVQERVEDLAFTCSLEDLAASARWVTKSAELEQDDQMCFWVKCLQSRLLLGHSLCMRLYLWAGDLPGAGCGQGTLCNGQCRTICGRCVPTVSWFFTSRFHLPSPSSSTRPWCKYVLLHMLAITVLWKVAFHLEVYKCTKNRHLGIKMYIIDLGEGFCPSFLHGGSVRDL